MKHILLFFITICSFLFFNSCQNKVKHDSDKNETIKVALLKGPSSIAFIHFDDSTFQVDGKTLEVKIYDNPAKVQAMMMKQEVDICIIPTMLAANLYNKGIMYKMLACPAWGNLYLMENTSVKNNQRTNEVTIYQFSQGSTPDVLTSFLHEKRNFMNGKKLITNYRFSSLTELSQALLSGKIKYGVFPEPYKSYLMEINPDINVAADLSYEFYKSSEHSIKLAQTAVMVNEACLKRKDVSIESVNKLLKKICDRVKQNPEGTARLMIKHKVTNNQITADSIIQGCKIEYINASECENSVLSLLNLMFLYNPKSIGNKIPDTNFFIK